MFFSKKGGVRIKSQVKVLHRSSILNLLKQEGSFQAGVYILPANLLTCLMTIA